MKKLLAYTLIGAAAALTACDDYLDSEPITSVSTTAYLNAEADLKAYSADLYTRLNASLPTHGGYNLGVFQNDNGTDNQTSSSPSSIFVTGQTYVGGNTWSNYMADLRRTNYFLDQVLPRIYAGKITGNKANSNHYVGEVFFFRAWVHWCALRNFGDFPIVDRVITDNYDDVREASRRQPRNLVARFIIADLDSAYKYMSARAPQTNRLTRDCAALLKSRVALYEGTWEKYHAGTARVPKGQGWPGATADYLSGFNYNADQEINYFFQQAIAAADIVAGNHPDLYNNYAAMFNSVDLSGMDEILLWRRYSVQSGATSTHNVVSYLQRNGAGNTGFTRSMVDSYLMADGTPIYASSDYKGDDTYEHLFDGRDPRMDMTILKPGDMLSLAPMLIEYIRTTDGYGYFYRAPIFDGVPEQSNPTGYSLRKGLSTAADMYPTAPSYTGCPIFRTAEAFLNYIEAYYELNGTLGGNCEKYWKAIRKRAGVSENYQATIDATDMSQEKADWGSYSAGNQIDATLYNIRRERRIELAAEGLRFDDLKRWRALDQVKNVHIQGCNFWDQIFTLYTAPDAPDAASPLSVISLVEYGSEGTANISAKNDQYAEGKYILPYRKNTANIGFNGLNWNPVKYLTPINNAQFRLTTAVQGSGDFATSSIYQNPGWQMMDGTLPEGD